MHEEKVTKDKSTESNTYKMAMYLQADSDSTGTKVWQPWYKESSQSRGSEDTPLSGGGKELPTRLLKEQRMRLVRNSPIAKQRREVEEESEDEINVVDTSPPSIPQQRMVIPSPSHSPRLYHPPPEHSPRLLYPGPPLSPHVYQLPPAHSPVHPTYTVLPPPHSPHMFHPLAAYSNSSSDSPHPMEEEGPIDMSIKKPPTSLSSPPVSIHSSNPPPYIPPRPSVITVASPDRYSPATAPPRVSPPPPPYNVATAQLLRHRGLLQPINSNHHPTDRRNPHNKIAARQDSEVDTKLDIEEHFRRSLGTTYSHIFDERTTVVEEPDPPVEAKEASPPHSDENDDVDTHFSKALGKFWVDFKAMKDGTPPPPPAYSSSIPPPPSYNSTTTISVTSSDTSHTSTYQPATITRVTSCVQEPVFTYQHKLYNRVTSGRGQSLSPSAVSSSAPSSPSSRASPSTFTHSQAPSNSYPPSS